ncbi:MAG: outer membrane beta-barrel protein [Terriglobales bacterium]|jgi:opacity protein-like surface antigen
MHKAFALVPLLGLLAAARPMKAQEQASKLEVYGGYYYARFNINANVPGIAPSATYNGNGGGGQLEYNANRWLGVVGDLSGFYATSSGSGAFAGAAFTYLLGPRVNFRRGKVTPFAQALFGGVWTTDGIAQSTGPENNFAMTAGGGIAIKVSRHVSVRPVQAEYFMTKIPDGLNNRQDNLRLGAGIVLRLGRE